MGGSDGFFRTGQQFGGQPDGMRSVFGPGDRPPVKRGDLDSRVEFRGGGSSDDHRDVDPGLVQGAHRGSHFFQRRGDQPRESYQIGACAARLATISSGGTITPRSVT